MTELTIYSVAVDLIHLIIGLGVIFLALRLFDKLVARHFTDSFEKLYENPIGLGIYLGLRFLGVCYYASGFLFIK